MNILKAIKTRKSIRDFKHDPVSKEILTKILDAACRAPSAENTQPWEFTVIAGDVLEEVKKANIAKLTSGIYPNPKYTAVRLPRDSIYWQRKVNIAKQLFKLMDIARDDKEKRARWMELGFKYFNAPAVVILLMDRMLPDTRPMLDIGAVMQNICLAALEFDLGTCIENQGVMYPDVLREFAAIPSSRQIITSIAIGYPNWDFPANTVKSIREPIEKITTWLGF